MDSVKDHEGIVVVDHMWRRDGLEDFRVDSRKTQSRKLEEQALYLVLCYVDFILT